MSLRRLPRLLVCSQTREYRRAACELVLPGDFVLEVGCHEGLTTALLAARCQPQGGGPKAEGWVLGVDRSNAAVVAARRRFPDLRFEALDVPGELQKVLPELLPTGQQLSVAFLDLGGDAKLSAVLRALVALESLPSLRLLVTKSQALRETCRWSQAAASEGVARIGEIELRPW